jgi:protein SCO1/2
MKTIFFLFTLSTITLVAADVPTVKKDAELPPCCRAALAAGKPTDRSLYQLESTWTSDVGRKVKLSVLRGRPQVLAMFFSNCEYACPILVNEMKQLEAKLPADVLAKVDFLLVSFDTKRDTPEALAAYRRKENLATGRWTLLRGENDDVRELAALLGVNYAADSRGQFAHSNIITLLNAEGEIAFQHNGLKQDPAALITAITKAAAKAER